ncbi:uncharacterized protein LOC119288343 isoform X4 [Triticum dicoccoides]|uniref:uncharacterized protein LOC119288343 isoform X4 n=1 Tax=Triticum dicoccoides TaxID=85692 RepID=UPI00188FB30F|nr:uncharacterized protein LOC119288343 isoform X4 [Triticum dicoccoides]XP_037423872.1 uncharacterized protein LOC119288343 isoform X4 [Triticum dicoccoides]
MANNLHHVVSAMPEAISYTLLKEITKNFSDELKIGEGGFGKVYKAIYNEEEIAVKRLFLISGLVDETKFNNELLNLVCVQHQNIVKLVGYCYAIQRQVTEYNGKQTFANVDERVLCFEYFPSGSLKKHLSDESRELNWYRRYKIIVGICEGLNFLHNGSEREIYHLDLKPANILLDENWMPKICDFGLSRLINDSTRSFNTEHLCGSHPFMPPEYIETGGISKKHDVFSLGVTIIQIIAGPNGYGEYVDMPFNRFAELALLNWRGRIEGTSKHVEEYCQQVKKCITIASACVGHDKDKRPTIGSTLEQLQAITHRTVEEEEREGEQEQLEQIETTIDRTIEEEEREGEQEQKNFQVVKYGPWGGNGGTAHDIGAASSLRLKSVTIRYGDIIDSLTFSYSDHSGYVHTVGPWGGTGGANKYTINLDPTDFVKEISGKFGPYPLSHSNVITSLKLVTHEDTYGPFGFVEGTPFCGTLESGWAIVGFFARAERYVHKIGVYARPLTLDAEGLTVATTPGTSGATTKEENGQEGDSTVRDCDMAIKLQNITSLTLRVLQEITDNFSEKRKIGQGTYGKVYVAELENGKEIAVKVLYNNMPKIDDEQFQSEFENLMRLEHHNIVRLVAYCYETQHQPMQYGGRTVFAERTYRALCFEYMQNGSLEKHLSDEGDRLDWHTCYKIIKGTWKGLKHLHEGFDQPIYHLDLKPSNILLDKNMVPKLADFGLSRLFGDKQTIITQTPIGTIGYVPMEFLHGNIVSNKFDIFSLGVVMIKIIAGNGGHSRSVEMPLREFFDMELEEVFHEESLIVESNINYTKAPLLLW